MPIWSDPNRGPTTMLRLLPILAAAALAGCAGASGYQPAPPGIPEAVNAHCNFLGAQAAGPDMRDLAVRSQCLNYYRMTGQVPGAVASVR